MGSQKTYAPLLSWEEEKRISSLNGYVLQIASFRERDRAESLQKSMSEVGYRTFLEKVALDNGETTYRVRLGPYPQLMNAQEAARQIESKSGFRAIILPASSASPSTEKPS